MSSGASKMNKTHPNNASSKLNGSQIEKPSLKSDQSNLLKNDKPAKKTSKLFGFKRLAGVRSSLKSSLSSNKNDKSSSKKNLSTKPSFEDVSKEDEIYVNSPKSLDAKDSRVSLPFNNNEYEDRALEVKQSDDLKPAINEDDVKINELQRPRNIELKNAIITSNLSPLHAKKALIPKSSLVSSLVMGNLATNFENKTFGAQKPAPSSVPTNSATPNLLMGVLKSSIKSSSSNSSMSEFSTSSNQRPSKRVSFQNDVLIFADGGVSTYNNGLERGKSPVDKVFEVQHDRHVYREEDGTEIKLVPLPEDETEEQGDKYKSPPYYECCIIKNVDIIKDTDVIKYLAENKSLPQNDVTQILNASAKKDKSEIESCNSLESINSSENCPDSFEINQPISVHVEKEIKPKVQTQKSDEQPIKEDKATINWYKEQLKQVNTVAKVLRTECENLKEQQQTTMVEMNRLIEANQRAICDVIKRKFGSYRPLRRRRLNLDCGRHEYGIRAANSENKLSEIEAAVEEMRHDVVERKCRVSSKEVETLVRQLSQAGRCIASMKYGFPNLSNEIKSVAMSESEVIRSEFDFVENEPIRLEKQLKRCQQLTATLFTLKKLAAVQEARLRSQQGGEDEFEEHGSLMSDIQRIPIDHDKRMESIQALEMAEKVLRRTDHLQMIERRQQEALHNNYKQVSTEAHQQHSSNLTASESSSLDSLPSHPLPMDHHDVMTSQRLMNPPSWSQMMPPSYQPPKFHSRGGYSGGSLPRRSMKQRNFLQGQPLGGAVQPLGGQHQVTQGDVGRNTPIHMMERSQSAVPFLHNRNFGGHHHHHSQQQLHQPPFVTSYQPFVTSYQQPQWAHNTTTGYSENNLSNGNNKMMKPVEASERNKSDATNADKTRNLQEQYSKLQRMQRFHKQQQQHQQRNAMNNKTMNGNIQQAVYMP